MESDIKIAFHIGGKHYNPKMKDTKMNEKIIEQLTETFKQEFNLVTSDLRALKQAVK